MLEFVFKDGKVQKGKPLLVGIIFTLVSVLGGITYTVSAYAAGVIEKQQEEVKDLSKRVVSLESAKPATRKDLTDELKDFASNQQKLYSDLVQQTQKTTEITVEAYAESHKAIVGVLLAQQKQLALSVEAEFDKASKRNEDLNEKLEVLQDITNKDRDAIKLLQQNFNTTLAQAQSDRETLVKLLNELTEKLEKEQ